MKKRALTNVRAGNVLGAAMMLGLPILLPAPALAEIKHFKIALSSGEVIPAPAQQHPPRQPSKGTGSAVLSYNTNTKELIWLISYDGLSGPATSVKFHSPAERGEVAPANIVVYGGLTSPINGRSGLVGATITPAMLDALQAGKMYLDIATTAHPLGEIRGQVAADIRPVIN